MLSGGQASRHTCARPSIRKGHDMHRSIGPALLAAMAMALAASSAFAMTAAPGGAITGTSLGSITFRGGEISVSCPLTLRGSVNREIADRAGASVGSISSGTAGRCSTGSASLLFGGGAWSIALASGVELRTETEGEATLTFDRIAIEITSLAACLYGGSLTAVLPYQGTPFRTGLITVTATNVRRVSGSFLCPATGTLSGSFGITAQTIELQIEMTPDPRIVQWRGERGTKTVRFRNDGETGFLTALGWEEAGIEAGYELRELACGGRRKILAGAQCELKVTPRAGAREGLLLLFGESGIAGSVRLEP